MSNINNNDYTISTDDMIKYLDKFDYAQKKYLINDRKLLEKLKEMERKQQYGKLQKLSPAYVGQTIDRVYGFSSKQRIESAKIFSCVFSKIINDFLNINGLETLFNEHYYDFEWDMHLEYDTQTSSYNYYRDHMEHQVRNMYMMLRLLDDYGLIYEIKKLFSQNSNSKVSEYVSVRHQEFIESQVVSEEKRKILLKCSCIFYKNLISDYLKSESFDITFSQRKYEPIIIDLVSFFEANSIALPKEMLLKSFKSYFGFSKDRNKVIRPTISKKDMVKEIKKWFDFSIKNQKISNEVLIRSYIQDYSILYIIHSATIISALFHDVSYPLCFFMNVQRRIGQYLPSMNAFIQNKEADIDRIVSILQPSLLFVLVGEKEIRANLAKNQKKYDHGVFSAIALLLSFYESGRIHQLSIDKQIAIELAALSIYGHNFAYNINKESDKEYYRPIFTHNPLSFILKVADDMQEWDRRYFELSKQDENIFCPKCMSPIIVFKEYKNDCLKESLICRCSGDRHRNYRKSTFFPNRNMYTVTTCHDMNAIPINGNLIFKLNYNLLDLLHMSQISSSYASYRSGELKKLKVLMLNQEFSNSSLPNGIKNMYLDYTMSANPLYLKSKILFESILKECSYKNGTDINSFCDLNNEKVMNVIDRNYSRFLDRLRQSFDKCFFENKFESYEELYECFKTEVIKLFKSQVLKNIRANGKNTLFSLFFSDFQTWQNMIALDLNRILEGYMVSSNDNIWNKNSLLTNELIKMLNNKLNGIVVTYVTKIMKDSLGLNCNVKNITNNNFKRKIMFYFKLARYILTSFIMPHRLPPERMFMYEMRLDYYEQHHNADSRFAETINILLKDFYDTISKQSNLYKTEAFDINNYINQYDSSDKVYEAIEKYANPANWYTSDSEIYRDFSDKNIDYHSDLLLFELLAERLYQKDISP